MKRSRHLLIIGGTGRNAGKSTLAETLISKFSNRSVYAIKITPHFHPDTAQLMLLKENDHYRVYRENADSTGKDTSRMLKAGAAEVFLITTGEECLGDSYDAVSAFIPEGSPVICESPALRRIIEPDLFVIIKHTANQVPVKKNIDDLFPIADVVMTLEDLRMSGADVIDLDDNNNWHLKLKVIGVGNR